MKGAVARPAMERSSLPTKKNFQPPLILRKRLEEMRLQMGMTQKELALKLGISAPYLNEIITGKKSGRRKIIDFAKRLDVAVEQLTEDRLLIPLVAELTATEPFRGHQERCLDFIDISHLPGIARETARNCYALRVRGNSMIPFQKDGDLLIVEKKSHAKIRSGDKVIVHNYQLSFIRFVESMDELLILRPLNLSLPTEAESKASLSNLDKVIYIIPA
jgi:SOS-response transcriptional repressor LexA